MNIRTGRLLCAPLALAVASGVALAQDGPAANMSFFITSVGSGDGANLGGLSGADAHCQSLAEAAGSRGKTWRAYLSATPDVNARDRIGSGPWYNYQGMQVAAGVDDLHSDNNLLNKENSLNEQGGMVNGRGDEPNMHDILTGSTGDGLLAPAVPVQARGGGERVPLNMTCNNWSTSAEQDNLFTKVGHHDRVGGGADGPSWNSAHESRGCSQTQLQASGGNGLFYCFAID